MENMAVGLASKYFACESLRRMGNVNTYISIPEFLDPSVLPKRKLYHIVDTEP